MGSTVETLRKNGQMKIAYMQSGGSGAALATDQAGVGSNSSATCPSQRPTTPNTSSSASHVTTRFLIGRETARGGNEAVMPIRISASQHFKLNHAVHSVCHYPGQSE